MSKISKKSDTLDFESSLKKLERVVEKLESGELTLEESVKTFEEGIALSKTCQRQLKAAEQKIETLSAESGKLEDFSEEKVP